MGLPEKPGGGNKPQPYIPSGYGDESGEYTNKTSPKSVKRNEKPQPNCHIKNQPGLFNPLNSLLVKKVENIAVAVWGNRVPTRFKRNCVVKTVIHGEITKERYYNDTGIAYLDIHYTNHGNPKTHPKVPHTHRIEYVNGSPSYSSWEEFK